MANKKLIEDLKQLRETSLWHNYDVSDIASRALEEIEYLENEIRIKQSALDWYDFKPGDMK